ncbi:hypothetical protein DNX69_21305 [Rhodopseudomonas palustris]|uniref:Type II toxin-antitoxin system RelE/ParE family toxin n=1 Tax=Rhodopseudomonas palustris TaxID=1076 RepID=A0A323UG44_RHOPL|nr:hypothetical protein DNX69_21305 [Rhodopseudomonas palustris]
MGRDSRRIGSSPSRRIRFCRRNCGAAVAAPRVTVRFTRRATEDLREILDYLSARNPAAADRVRQSVAATVRLIADRPHIGLRNSRAPAL